MIFYYPNYMFIGLVAFFVLACVITLYTFWMNYRRLPDDPKKRDYHPLAILVTPFTAPFYFAFWVLSLISLAVLYVGFLVVFTIMLVLIRKWFFFDWWHKFAIAVGDPMLRLNSYLIRGIFRPFQPYPRSRQQPASS